MSKTNTISRRGYEHTDFSELLLELQAEKEKESSGTEGTDEGEPGTASESAAAEEPGRNKISDFRHRILSDEKVRYLYSRQKAVLHEKHCFRAREIADEDLEWAQEYVPGMEQCPECALDAYLWMGARDPEEKDVYQQLFARFRITEEQIRNMYVERKMITRVSRDALTVWYKDDTWRIKALPAKGHVQLYHNNYAVRRGGVREFTQGFHIQNLSCEDTNISYALGIIRNYEYRPEEAMLHSSAGKAAGIRKIKKKKLRQQEGSVGSLEELMESLSGKKTLWGRFREKISAFIGRKRFFPYDGFQAVEDAGYPADKTICIYIWRDKRGKLLWQTGAYDQKQGQFSVKFGTVNYTINQEKVIAWKKMTPEAMELGE